MVDYTLSVTESWSWIQQIIFVLFIAWGQGYSNYSKERIIKLQISIVVLVLKVLGYVLMSVKIDSFWQKTEIEHMQVTSSFADS